MKHLRFLSVLMIVILIISCANQSPLFNETQKADAEKQIREIYARWLELAKSHDVDGLTALVADYGTLYRQNQEPVTGKLAVRAQFEKDYGSNSTTKPSWTTDKIEISASGDIGIEYGTWHDKGLGPDGNLSDCGNFVTFTTWLTVFGKSPAIYRTAPHRLLIQSITGELINWFNN